LHILIIPSEEYVPDDFPLSGIFQQDQAQALKRAGYKVGVITPQLRLPVSLKFARTVFPPGFRSDDDQGIPVMRYYGYYLIPRMARLKMRVWLRAGKALYKRYVQAYGRPDLVHAHNALYAGTLADAIHAEWGTPYVLTEHSSIYAQGLVPKTLLPEIRSAFARASCRIVVSPSLGDIIGQVLGENVTDWEWVPNIISYIFEDVQPIKMPEKHDQYFRFFNAAGLVEVKGHADLLEAFAQAFRDDENVVLRIAGDGPLMGELKALSSRYGIEKKVFFLGEIKRSDVLAEMLACDAYVQPSRFETFGLAIVEALACGKPVVSTCTEGAKYFINRGNGISVPINDVPSLASAMKQMRLKAREYDDQSILRECINHFGEEAIVNRLTSIYNGVISQSEGSSIR
jgi:glycosyltransferase involved in cell wall biosynthesis